MSNHNWAEHGMGLVLSVNDPVTNVFVKAVAKAFNERDDLDTSDIPELFEHANVGCVRYYDDEMDGKTFHPVINGHGESFEHDNMLVFWAEMQPEPFKAVYTEASLADEFRRKIGKYLSDDFDYMAHIGYFSCSIYC